MKKKGSKKAKKNKVAKVMHEYKAGTLKFGSGDKVKNKKQAVAIALSEAGMAKMKRKHIQKRSIWSGGY